MCAAATTSLPESLGGERNPGITATRGCATPPSPCRLSCSPDTPRKRPPGLAGSGGPRPVAPVSCRSCTAWAGIGVSRSSNSTRCPATRAQSPCGSATRASTQFQLDVFGEVLDSALTAARSALPGEAGWDPDLVLAILDHLETVWDEPDNGIWEVRGPRRHFTHSKVMAWVAFDRAIQLADDHHVLPADRVAHWTRLRDRIHAEVCDKGFDPEHQLLHPVLRLHVARRQLADAGPGWVPASRRSPYRRHGGGHPGEPGRGRLRPPLSNLTRASTASPGPRARS